MKYNDLGGYLFHSCWIKVFRPGRIMFFVLQKAVISRFFINHPIFPGTTCTSVAGTWGRLESIRVVDRNRCLKFLPDLHKRLSWRSNDKNVTSECLIGIVRYTFPGNFSNVLRRNTICGSRMCYIEICVCQDTLNSSLKELRLHQVAQAFINVWIQFIICMISQRKLVWDKLETTGAFALFDPIWMEKEYSDGKRQLAERDVQLKEITLLD